jgi:MFS family permease
MVIQGQERVDGGQPSPWAPLHNRIYRNLFIAQFVSNIGTWMQSVAAQWFLVEAHSSAVIVALVQTASLGPTLLLGLFAGALADLFDRRRFLIFMQSYAVLVTLALAVLAYLGRLGPTSLLMFTVAIGCASALTGPAWQAIQPEVVPRNQIPAAATLSSVSANAARAIGPAIGGVVVALAGPAAVFAINAVSFAGIIVALAAWKRPKQSAQIEREHLGQAIITVNVTTL